MKEKITKEMALNSVNNFLKERTNPVETNQLSRANTDTFKEWLKKSSLMRSQKPKLLKFLQSLIDDSAIRGVIIKNARLLVTREEVDILFLGVPNSFRPKLKGLLPQRVRENLGKTRLHNLFVLEDSGSETFSDHIFKKCWCPSCVCRSHAWITNSDAPPPPDQCQSSGWDCRKRCGGCSSPGGDILDPGDDDDDDTIEWDVPLDEEDSWPIL